MKKADGDDRAALDPGGPRKNTVIPASAAP